MSKLTHNRKILYFQTAVLAEPSDQYAGRPGQKSKIFFLYKIQPHCLGLVRKVDLLSMSLGLKTAVLAEPSDHNSCRPVRVFTEELVHHRNSIVVMRQ
jgi:hypothetical protein